MLVTASHFQPSLYSEANLRATIKVETHKGLPLGRLWPWY